MTPPTDTTTTAQTSSSATPALRSIADLPAPPGLPWLGNAHQLTRPSRVHATLELWARRYGPIVRVDLGSRHRGPRSYIISLSDAEEINAVLRDRPEGFGRWREQRAVFDEVGIAGVFTAEGEQWRRQRRLVVTALNTNHLLRYYHVVRTTTERLYRRLAGAAREGRTLDIGHVLTSFSVDTISALAFGHDLNTLEYPENELQSHIQRAFGMLQRRIALPVPYWRWLKLPADRALDRSMAVLHREVGGFIEQARERIAARPELLQAPEDFLEGMLAAQATDNTFTDEEIIGNTLFLLFAGEDTTSHTLSWTVWFLARRPDIQARLAQETGELFGEHPFPVDYETVGQLHYTEAVLRESIRLKTVVPMTTIESLVDTTICGTHIPANTRLMVLLRHASLGERNASDFDPQRWLEDGEDADAPRSLGFGAGPRFCAGRNLAFLEGKAALAMIARNFEVELDESGGPVTEHLNFTLVPQGLRVRLRERRTTPSRSTTGTSVPAKSSL
jgi:cytochrome P450